MPPIPDAIWSKLTRGAECLPRACAVVSEQFYMNQLMLAGNLFIDTLNQSKDGINARMVNEIEFSFNDLRQLTDELMPAEKEAFSQCFETIESGLEELKEYVPFPDVDDQMTALRRKLKERLEANERSKFAPPDAEKEPLPHPPSSLQSEAEEIRRELHRGGFETPAMDKLAERPDQFEIRDCDAVIEEIDGIQG